MSETKIQGIAPALRDSHWEWRKEVENALAQVRTPEAGVWARWAAVRYLMDQFLPRLERETHILTGMADQLPAAQSGHIWALGELLEFLCHHLCELGTMPQCGPAFADGVTKLLRALHFWCAEVDEAIKTVEQDELGPEATRDFDTLLEPGVEALATA
jgi:hypothetical protein